MNEQEMQAQIERQNQRIARLEARLEENERMGVIDTAVAHPFKHVAKPGVGNKLEAGLGIAGRGLAVYGIYRGVAWVVGKIAGA